MARANRHFTPGYTWHLTHRCHKREFLTKSLAVGSKAFVSRVKQMLGYRAKSREIVAASDEEYHLRDSEIVYGNACNIQGEGTGRDSDGENEIPWNTGIALDR